MKAPIFFRKSIRFYFAFFLIFGVTLLLVVNLALYNQGLNIRETVQKQSILQAENELLKTLSVSLNQLQKEASSLAEWDEVHQQFHDPSYYFFWHDERLKESGFFKPYYDDLELYKTNKKLLTPASPDAKQHFFLPDEIKSTQPTLVFTKNFEVHLNIFQEIKSRDSENTIGYVGISLDFLSYLLNTKTFYYLDKSSINLYGSGSVPYSEIMQHIHFKPVSNPVNDYLWQLIQDFIIELIIIMLIVSLILTFFFNITIYQPLQIISSYLLRLKNSPKKTHPLPKETFLLSELDELKNSLHDYHRDLFKVQNELDKQNQAVWDQARRDVLTNIYNRRAFDEAWNETVSQHEKTPSLTAFMLFDCDFFKALNDTYGHEVGDEVIKLTAATIQQSLPLDCPAYRIGGDEFAVILKERTPEETINIAQHCLIALNEAPYNRVGVKETLTFSVGISSTLEDLTNEITNLPRQADMAMYKAKQSLNEKVQCYHHSLDYESLSLVSNNIVNTVVNAIHNGSGIQMHYQPIKSINSQKVYYESLIRIKQDEGIIYPNDIFAVVNRRRLEVELDQQVITCVLHALQNNEIPKDTGVSINVSGKTLLQANFCELFTPFIPFLEKYKIVIEVTENSLIDHMDYAQKALNSLRKEGFLIALDDFGSGYSSIRYLAHMPVDIVKYDMSMTNSLMGKDVRTHNILKTTAEMIIESGYDLVMEGVETEEMLEAVREAGGNSYSRLFNW
ncbi:bifunctional diguanylate cyclase/phosphodiesterase [Thiomicrorhabdus sp. Milos-T2]|uniref:bifunctional diguanylate cyclase/phosphodiesterase n=1 Tax=Thiomicrorhabdus sp. Milos-T2 TaxID=90814 RepID=UPI000494977A|nr:bifunctional diguanylate cyclase/phosphodiesterase [Thiomicrorhabdus sp. Milos-T2]